MKCNCAALLENRFVVLFGCIFIFILFTLDIATWVTGFNVNHYSTHCKQPICLDKWLICSGLVSMYLNFFRLWDLAHLYAVIGEESFVSRVHFFVRMLYESIVLLFHVANIIVGVYLIEFLDSISDEDAEKEGYDRNVMFINVVIVTSGHIAYVLISFLIGSLKILYLKREPA